MSIQYPLPTSNCRLGIGKFSLAAINLPVNKCVFNQIDQFRIRRPGLLKYFG